ncbi:hypothetical protein PAEVO_10720 [Paenibacillus sp. GM2FR]|uniref:DUF3885 domain-containing protein n=1 Tax=Paenibacillus TaxID=44249 RepID=UPI000C27C573|nr:MULTISPECIES: DUF3885 domain-containing protein [Paenibacillus]MEC0255658.1 DUF3885 domain-containing protein [Paenibacillus lautus]PJN54351.1 hypothetical protein PAEVO_10720 [Paenibacillus sp. GM2FR]
MTFDKFINDYFPNLIVRPPLLYNWNTGIRFELGDPHLYDLDVSHYMEQVYSRTTELFRALFMKDDDIFIVTNAIFAYRYKYQVKKLKLYSRYIRNKQVLKNLKLTIIPDIYAEDDEEPNEENNTYRYIINCKVSDVDNLSLLKAICNQDVGIKPSIHHDVFFININKGLIFHIYDDRGCDVISSSILQLKDIYIKFNEWILDYDREEIKKIFEGKH